MSIFKKTRITFRFYLPVNFVSSALKTSHPIDINLRININLDRCSLLTTFGRAIGTNMWDRGDAQLKILAETLT